MQGKGSTFNKKQERTKDNMKCRSKKQRYNGMNTENEVINKKTLK